MADYPKPSLTVDAVVLAGEGEAMRLLAIERDRPPFAGRQALPGGFVDPYELPPLAAARELAEETGLRLPPGLGVPLTLRARKGRDPRGWTVSQPFLFWLPEPRTIAAGDDARRADWLPLAALERLAFDHGAILCEALGAFWPGMPGQAPALRGKTPFAGPTRPLDGDTVFFGGSFNPWHEGHSACLALIPRPERVIVAPDANPFKADDATKPDCAWRRFREILNRAAPHGCAVFPGFCGKEGPNPTAAWLPHTAAPAKNLLMGDDNLASLPRWTEAETLARALNAIYVAPRQASAEAIAQARDWLRRINPDCRVVVLGDHPHRGLSSTALRRENAADHDRSGGCRGL